MPKWRFQFQLNVGMAEVDCLDYPSAATLAHRIREAGLEDTATVIPPLETEAAREVVRVAREHGCILTAKGIWEWLSLGLARNFIGEKQTKVDPAIYQIAVRLRREGWKVPTVWSNHQRGATTL